MALATGCPAGEVSGTQDASSERRPDVVAEAATDVRPDAPAPDTTIGDDVDDQTPDNLPDGATYLDAEPEAPSTGSTMRVTASMLNLRTGPGTTNMILTAMPCGTQVTVLGGPTTGWWNVRYMTYMGWASGAYLVAEPAFDPAVCGGTPDPPPAGTSPEVARIMQLARYGVGYSYYWGHGSWREDGADHGSCSGSCPSCTHSGRYGADCSGFVGKVWQIPSPSPLTTDSHPYSTYNFYHSNTHWSHLSSRAAMRQADALVYNASGRGHIVLFDSGADPWGSIWTYEARGCSYGIVHNLRTVGSTYVPIRREGL